MSSPSSKYRQRSRCLPAFSSPYIRRGVNNLDASAEPVEIEVALPELSARLQSEISVSVAVVRLRSIALTAFSISSPVKGSDVFKIQVSFYFSVCFPQRPTQFQILQLLSKSTRFTMYIIEKPLEHSGATWCILEAIYWS